MELATRPCPACLVSTAQSWPLCRVRVSWLPHRALFSWALAQSPLTVTHSESRVIERRLWAGRVTFESAWVGERVRPREDPRALRGPAGLWFCTDTTRKRPGLRCWLPDPGKYLPFFSLLSFGKQDK